MELERVQQQQKLQIKSIKNSNPPKVVSKSRKRYISSVKEKVRVVWQKNRINSR